MKKAFDIFTGEPMPNGADFTLNEIEFFTEGLRKEKSDYTALLVFRSIKEFLQKSKDAQKLRPFLGELNNYLDLTSDANLCWEYVYAVRAILDVLLKDAKDNDYVTETAFASAEAFERICELSPTHHNRCCRVKEYIYASMSVSLLSGDAKATSQSRKKALSLAHKHFSELENDDSVLYYDTGISFYLEAYNLVYRDEKLKDKLPEILRNLSEYGYLYLLRSDQDSRRLSVTALAYLEYSKTPDFDFSKEKDRIKDIIRWLNFAINGGMTSLKSTCSSLRSLWLKHMKHLYPDSNF